MKVIASCHNYVSFLNHLTLLNGLVLIEQTEALLIAQVLANIQNQTFKLDYSLILCMIVWIMLYQKITFSLTGKKKCFPKKNLIGEKNQT